MLSVSRIILGAWSQYSGPFACVGDLHPVIDDVDSREDDQSNGSRMLNVQTEEPTTSGSSLKSEPAERMSIIFELRELSPMGDVV